jgi:hypothetical protein
VALNVIQLLLLFMLVALLYLRFAAKQSVVRIVAALGQGF